MADAVRAVLVKRAFVPGDPAAGGMMPQDPAAGGAMPQDPAAGGMMPQDPAAGGAMPMDAMAGLPGGDVSGAMPAQGGGMINMTADEFTSFIKKMMAAFQGGNAAVQQAQPDIGAKLDTLIAVLQGQKGQAAGAPAVVAGA